MSVRLAKLRDFWRNLCDLGACARIKNKQQAIPYFCHYLRQKICTPTASGNYAKMNSQRDRRVAIRALLDSGLSVTEVAHKTGASRVTVTAV